MRILLTEAAAGDSAALEQDALERGIEVSSCQPAHATVRPCVGATGAAPCPLERHVDAVIDVRPGGDQDLSLRELGVVCAMRASLPIVMVGSNPLGPAATSASQADALNAAVRLAHKADARPPVSEITRQARKAIQDLGGRHVVTWVGYVDVPGGFDVVVEVSHALTRAGEERLTAALAALFWQAIRDGRFGRVICEPRRG